MHSCVIDCRTAYISIIIECNFPYDNSQIQRLRNKSEYAKWFICLFTIYLLKIYISNGLIDSKIFNQGILLNHNNKLYTVLWILDESFWAYVFSSKTPNSSLLTPSNDDNNHSHSIVINDSQPTKIINQSDVPTDNVNNSAKIGKTRNCMKTLRPTRVDI